MFLEWLFEKTPEPKTARLPIEKKRQTATDEAMPQGYQFNKRLDKWERHRAEPQTVSFEWDFDMSAVATENATQKRSKSLDRFDVAALKEKELNLEAAIIIKPFFASETPREDAARMIAQKGLHQGTIKNYYAAFNAAEKERNAPKVPS